jgi:hypothetical protein
MEIGTWGRLAAFPCWRTEPWAWKPSSAISLGKGQGRFQKSGLQMHANGSYRANSFESDLTRDAIQRGSQTRRKRVTAINNGKRCRIESA